jgi:hypothetical protein
MAIHGISVIVKQSIGGVPFENNIHLYDTGTHTPDEIATGVAQAWVSTGSIGDVVQTTDVHYLGFNIRNIDGVHDGVDTDWNNATDTGQLGTETAPISIALLYSLRTEHAGKSGRGRMYIAGVRHDLYASMQLKWNLSGSAGIDAAPAGLVFANAISDALDTATLAVYSRKNDAVYPVTNAIAQTLFGEQRRRSGRVSA